MQKSVKPPTLPSTGFIKLSTVLQLLPYGKTRWYAGVKSGEFPKPIKLGSRAAAYRVEDIAALIERLSSQTTERLEHSDVKAKSSGDQTKTESAQTPWREE